MITKNRTLKEDWENTVTAIDPNDYMEITEEGFVKQYGKAAEKFIAKIKSQSKSQIVEQILGLECMKKEKVENYMDTNNGYVHLEPEKTIRNQLRLEIKEAIKKL